MTFLFLVESNLLNICGGATQEQRSRSQSIKHTQGNVVVYKEAR